MSGAIRWSPWRAVEPTVEVPGATLAEVLDGGQTFRWWSVKDMPGIWQGGWSRHYLQLRSDETDTLQWRAPVDDETMTAPALRQYLAVEVDMATPAARFGAGDPWMAAAVARFPGLRVLRQPVEEALLCFLLSATKPIPEIRRLANLLARNYGEPVVGDWQALPTWERLADVGEEQLRQHGLGFRAKNIAATARTLATQPGWVDQLEAMPYAAARAWLCELPGVGGKIADCVCLFGLGHLEAFPVDTWIRKTLATRYGWAEKDAEKLATRARAHFGPMAGLAQQYAFALERAEARERITRKAAAVRSTR